MSEPIRTLVDDIPPAPAGPTALRCEFCACTLSQKGEVLTMSDRARALRRVEDALADEKTKHASTGALLAAAQARVIELETAAAAAAKPPADGSARWGYSGGDN